MLMAAAVGRQPTVGPLVRSLESRLSAL